MSKYNKLFAAVGATLASRWLLQYLGIDAVAIGVEADLKDIVSFGIDAAVAGFNGFWVWLLPNKAVGK